VLDVTGLERSLASAGGANLVSDQDADLAGLDTHPYVIAVHVIRDKDPGSAAASSYRPATRRSR
jgi:hypothetical protein